MLTSSLPYFICLYFKPSPALLSALISLQLAGCLDFALVLFLLPCYESPPSPPPSLSPLHPCPSPPLLLCHSNHSPPPPEYLECLAVQSCQSLAGPAKLHILVRGEAEANDRGVIVGWVDLPLLRCRPP